MPDKIKDFFKAEIAPTGLFKSEDEFRTYISDPKNASSFYESEVKPVGLFKDAEEFNSFLGLKKNDGLVSPTQNQQEVLPSNLEPIQSSVQNPRIEPSQEEDLSLLSVDELSKRYNKSKETINAYKEQVDKFKQEGEKGQVRLSGVANLYNYENNNLKNIADAYNQKIQQKAPKTPEPAPQAPTLLAKVREYQKIANAPVTKDYELNSMGDLDEVDNPASLKSKENAKVEYDKLIKEYATTTGISEDDLKQTLNDFPKISEDQKLVDYTKQRLENPAAYKRQKAASSWSNGLNDALVDYNQKAIAENKKPFIKNPVLFANQKREDLGKILKSSNSYSQFINFTENLRKEISYLPNEVVNGIMKNVAIEGQSVLEGAPDKDQYISNDPKSKNLNKYQVSWLNSIKISDPDLYKNRTRLLSVPMSKLEEQSSAKNEFSSLSPTSAIGASKAASAARNQRLASERVQLEAEEGGISMAKEDKTEKLDDLIRKSKTTGITQQEKEVADQLIVDLNQLDKDSKALNEKYPLATKDRDDQLLFSATGGELNRAERFAAKTVKGFDNALGFISDIISTPFMSKEQRVIQDLDELGGKRRFETKTARKQDDIVVGNYTINASPEFLKYIEEVDNDKSLTFEQKQQKKRDKYREDPYLITIKRNDNAGDLLFTSETVLNAVEDFGSQILPQLGLSAITGGGAAISKLRSLSTLFGTTFASGYKDNYLSAVEEGDAAPSTTAFRNTSIDALYELIGDDLAMVKKVFGKASGSIGKLVNSIDEAEWNKILSKKTGAFRAVKNVAKSFGKDVLLEGAKEATGEAAAAGTTAYLDNKEAYEPMKTAFVNTFVGSVATMGLGTVFNYKNITRAEKYAMYAAGANASAYLADIDESLKNGTITEDEANKRRQVIQSMSNIVNEMPKVDGMSDNEVVDFAFNKYIQEQAGKAEKVIPDNAKVKELVQNLNNENNNIINAATESTQQAGSTESNIGQSTGTLQGQQEVGEGQQGEATQQGANVSDSNIVSEGELNPELKDVESTTKSLEGKEVVVSETPKKQGVSREVTDLDIAKSNLNFAEIAKKEATEYLNRYKNNPFADKVSFNKAKLADANKKIKKLNQDISKLSEVKPAKFEEKPILYIYNGKKVISEEDLVTKEGVKYKRIIFENGNNELIKEKNYKTFEEQKEYLPQTDVVQEQAPVQQVGKAEEAGSIKPAKDQKSTEIATELSRELTGPGDMIESVSQSLKATGINTVQLSGEEFAARAAKDGAQADSMGYFDDQAKEFVLNKDKADKATVIHEGAHPVMNIIYNTNRPLYDKVVSGMKQAAAKNVGVQSAIEFGGQYEMQEGETKEQAQARMDNEALVETLAKIEDGEIDLDELPKSFKQSLIDMVNSVAKFFGFDQVLDDTDVAAFKKLVGQVYDALTTGEDISSIVGVENVTKFENKIGEGVQERKTELPEKQARQMTEDGKGNYVFYHYSGKNINTIDPNKFGSNLATGRDEKPGVGISMYYTKKDTSEPGVPSNFGYVVRVPKDKVYSFNDDPLNLLPAAEKLFKKQYPNQAFDPNKQIGFLTKVANSKGYKMTVANWNIKGSFALRAQTTEALKPEKYTRIKPGTLNQTEVLSPELDKLKPNSKKRVQQRVDTLSDVERKQKQLEIINKENPAPNDYNTWIRKVEDIKTAEEAFKSSEKEGAMYPDFTEKDMKDALSSGEVTVYSSQPIKEGVFVSPSKINAQEYAGGKTGKLYSEKVKLEDVAWIDEGEGQFASTKAIEGLLGKPKKVQQRKSAVEKTKEFKLAAFVIRKKSEGASVLELATGIASVMPGMSPVEINNLINDPQQYIRDKFNYLSPALQENLISRAGVQNIYANIPAKQSGAFSQLSARRSSVESYLASKDKTKAEKVSKYLGNVKSRWFDAARGMPNWVLALKDISSGTRNLEIDVAVNTTKKLKKAANSIKFNDWDAFTKAIKSLSVNATPQQNSLQIVPPEILALPQEIQPFVYEMRDQIDGLTKDLVASGYVTPDQAVALESNIGQYVNRAYRLFNEKGYKPSKEDITNAVNYYADVYIKDLAEKNAGVLTYDEIEKKAIEKAKLKVDEILNKKVTPYFKSGESRNIDILKKKEDIPEPIRKLMGEYTDPGTVFVMTVAKQAALRSASQLLTGLRDRGMGSVFFEENDPERPATHSTKIAAEGTETKNPLGGLYTTPEIAEQLQGIAKTTNNILDVWMKLVGTVRWGKTVGSVVTQTKNFESNVGFAVMNGLIFTGESGQGLKGAASYFGGRISGRELDELTAKVVSLGLVGQGVNAMELKKMLGSGDVHDIAVDLAVNGRSNYAKARNFVSAPIRAANKLYQLSDDFWKVYAYMNERHLIAKAMFGKSYDKLTEDQQVDVDIESSERVKGTWPTYDRVWEGAKYLSERVPLIGNFISFQAESVRVLSNTVKIALKDIKSGDPGFQALGYRRLFGIASYLSIRAGLTYAAATSAGMAVAGLLGIITGDDEEKEKLKGIKDALPQFMKTGDLLVIKGDKPGVFTVYNMSSIDPYNVMFNTMNALTEGREGMDAGPAAAVTEFFNGFMEPEMTYETVSSLLSNRSLKTGDKIYLDADNPGDKILKGAKYVWDNLEPSSVSLVNRLMEKENKGAEVSAVFGARPYDVDLNRSFRILLSTTTQDLETINKQYYKVKYNEKATPEEKKAAEKEAEEKIAYYSERIGNTYKRFLLLGASKEELDNIVKEKRAVKSTGWSKQLKKSIISGKINKDDFLK